MTVTTFNIQTLTFFQLCSMSLNKSPSSLSGSDSSYGLPQEHYTRKRQMPSFQALMTQRQQQMSQASNANQSARSPPSQTPLSFPDSDSSYELPQEHYTRARILPSFEALKKHRDIAATKNLGMSDHPLSDHPPSEPDSSDSPLCPSDSTSGSLYNPPSHGITFHENQVDTSRYPTRAGEHPIFHISPWLIDWC